LPLHSALPAGVLQVTVPAAFVVRVLTPFVRVAEEKSKISTKAELQIWGGRQRWLALSLERWLAPFCVALGAAAGLSRGGDEFS